MTTPLDSQNFESYIPVYDAIPAKWEDAKPFVVEQLKRLANGINIREIGWFLDQELLSGKAFIPGSNNALDGGSSQQFRTILRKVIPFPSLTIGLNQQPHGITVDASFSLMQLYAAATNATALTGEPIPNGSDTITYDATNINITVSAAYTRAWAVIEYIQEL
jgi:hypothetical protein